MGGAAGSNSGYPQQQVPVSLNLGPLVGLPRTQTTVSQALSAVLTKPGRIQALAPLVVSMRAQTAILQGTVASDHDRDLAEQLVRLEPGVAQVENNLIVAPPAAPTLPSP
jgi:osmotically-inducible protein OsmY